MRLPLCVFVSIICVSCVFCRRHTLKLKNDARSGILCSQFAYGTQGSLSVYLSGFARDYLGQKVGFSFEKSTSNSLVTSTKQKSAKCSLEGPTDKRVFTILLLKKSARLMDRTPDHAILVSSGTNAKPTPFSFANTEDEKTLESFRSKISDFLVEHCSFKIDADQISNDIITVVTGDEELRVEVVDLIKRSVSSDMAVYETLSRLLPPSNEIEDGNPVDNRRRSRRALPDVEKETKIKKETRSDHVLADALNDDRKADERKSEKLVRGFEGSEDDERNVHKDDGNDLPPQDPPRPFKNKDIRDGIAPQFDDNQVPDMDVGKGAAGGQDSPKNAGSSADKKSRNGAEVEENREPQIVAPRSVKAPENVQKAPDPKEASPPKDPRAADPPKPNKSRLSDLTVSAIKDAIEHFSLEGQDEIFHYTFTSGMVSLNFTVTFTSSSEVGSYDLVFHNCRQGPIDASIHMVERNGNNYLSLGEQPLAMLFSIFTLIYAALAIVWGLHLRFSKAPVFRIHHLMLAMVIVKSISLMFHSINFYVIGRHGVQEEGWAVMYYIAHMTRGFLLIVTILMIGAGWTYIKHVFSRQEKQVFLIVIPLQVFANVATIVINETEQGATRFGLWNEIFTIVDLLCCAGVLFPVIWSIRHLRQAAQSDGKVAQNLRKLRLFRHFYVLVICYIYFTRIIVYLLRMTTPFSWSWLVELFEQSVTLLFFISVGFKFRPFDDNPYLQLPTSDDQDAEDIVMQRFDVEEAWSQSGLAEGVTRIHRPQGLDTARENRRRRDDAPNRPLPSESEAADSDLLPLIRP